MKKQSTKVKGSDWSLVYDDYVPEQEKLRETLCTLGNGYMGTRGAGCGVSDSENFYPGTYIAGLYNKTPTKVADRNIYNDDLVNCPNWLPLTFKAPEGEWVSIQNSKVLRYRRELDFRKGILIRELLFQDRKKRNFSVTEKRVVSMDSPNWCALSWTIESLDYEGLITVRSSLDGTVINNGVPRYRSLNGVHLEPESVDIVSRDTIALSVRTSESDVEIAQASKIRLFRDGKEEKPVIEHVTEKEMKISQLFSVYVKKGELLTVEKNAAVFTSRDREDIDPLIEAAGEAAVMPRFGKIEKEHIRAWKGIWDKVDIKIEGDPYSQKILRFHIFHIYQTASYNNKNVDAGFTARGLTGEAYRGHVFWDEIYAFHLFDLRMPEVTKELFRFRYRRIGEAYKYAKESGYRGVMSPWQISRTGEEETQRVHLNPASGEWGPDFSMNQRHVSFAIAYNVWQYWIRTKDRDFLNEMGAEMFLGIAEFASSLVKYDKRDGKYHTYGLMGPDEFHEKNPGSKSGGYKDNAYSNLMISWILSEVPKIYSNLKDSRKRTISKKIGINKNEMRKWKDISNKMNICMNSDEIIEQFDGYFNLKELDWDHYKKKYGNIHRMDRILKAEGKNPDEFKVAKQADSLMIFYLFPLEDIQLLFKRLGMKIDHKTAEKNYDYYLARTSHGSTLSKVVHCYIAQTLGDKKEAFKWFGDVLRSDIEDVQGGTTEEGIHCGVMAGSVDIAVRGFAGVEIDEKAVKIEPSLPAKWKRIRFSLMVRGHWFTADINKKSIRIKVRGKGKKNFPLPFEINGKKEKIKLGSSRSFRYND